MLAMWMMISDGRDSRIGDVSPSKSASPRAERFYMREDRTHNVMSEKDRGVRSVQKLTEKPRFEELFVIAVI
jgi:hypothetical protein